MTLPKFAQSKSFGRPLKQDYIEDIARMLPPETAGIDYLLTVGLARLDMRSLMALTDALTLLKQSGRTDAFHR